MDGDLSLLSLKWNNHKTAFLHIIGNLRSKASYTDATLACNGKFYPVHRLVLSTCSEYFSAIFEQTSCKNPVIVLKDVDFKNLEYLLDYMYIGEVNVKQNELASLVGAAEYLQIKGLAVPDEELSSKINSSKRLPSDDHTSSPLMKKKKTSRNDSALLNLNSNEVSRESSPISQSSDQFNFEKTNLVEPSFVSVKCEPDFEPDIIEDNFMSEPSEREINQNSDNSHMSDKVSKPPEAEKDIEKEEPFDQSEDDINRPGPSGLYENDQYQHDTADANEPCSQLQEEAMLISSEQSSQGKNDPLSSNSEEMVDDSTPWQSESSFETEECESYINMGGIKFNKFMSVESGSWMYQCSICQYTTKCKRNSLRHTRTHTGEKPYSCPCCSYKAATLNQVQRHILTHTTEKKFICEICQYRSKTKESLGKHIKKHALEKPYECKFCDYSSSALHSLHHHISTCHKHAYSFRPI